MTDLAQTVAEVLLAHYEKNQPGLMGAIRGALKNGTSPTVISDWLKYRTRGNPQTLNSLLQVLDLLVEENSRNG